MKRPSFLGGAVAAAALAFASAAVIAATSPYIGTGAALRVVIPGVTLAYLVYLLRNAGTRTGAVVTLAGWSAVAFAAWWASLPLVPYALVHAGAIWLVRSLYYYAGILPALIDFGLSALAACAFAWSASRTGSVFLATWCFFLVQALFPAIPASVRRRGGRHEFAGNPAFERARRRADDALRQLAAR